MAKKSKVRRADHRLVDAHPHINDFSIVWSSSVAETAGSNCVVLCIVLDPRYQTLRQGLKCSPRVDPLVAEGMQRLQSRPLKQARPCCF